jgi:hypothetical protein
MAEEAGAARTTKARERVVLAAVFVGLVALYLANGTRFLGGDTLGSPYTALSLLRDGDFDIANQARSYPRGSYWFLQTPRARLSILGFGTPLVALPVYAAFNVAVWRGTWSENRLMLTGKVAGALMTALAAVLLALAARRFLTLPGAVAVALLFGVCSSAWSISSQALWKHSPAGLLSAAGLALLVWPRTAPAPGWRVTLSALPLALSAWCRENMVLVAAATAIYVAVVYGRWAALRFAAVAAVVGSGLLALNAAHFGSPFESAQRIYALQAAAREGARQWDTPLWLGVYGMFLSPSRGLLMFSPVFLACGFGLWAGRRDPERATWVFLAVAGALALAPGLKWHWWWGGDNYGPRMSVDAVPYLALLLVPAWRHARGRRGLAVAFGVLALFSATVQAAGAINYDGMAWDERSPSESINRRPQRLLGWTDSQLLFYLRFPHTRPDRIPWR